MNTTQNYLTRFPSHQSLMSRFKEEPCYGIIKKVSSAVAIHFEDRQIWAPDEKTLQQTIQREVVLCLGGNVQSPSSSSGSGQKIDVRLDMMSELFSFVLLKCALREVVKS